MKRQHLVKLLGIIAFIAALFFLFEVSGLRANFSLEFLRATIEANFVLGVIVFIAVFALGNLIQIPGWLFLAAAVLALGKVAGGVVTYVAAVFSCFLTYAIIGFLGQGALRGLEGPLAQRMFKRLDNHPVSSIALLRLVFQTVPVLNYALAMSAVKFRHYALGTLIGLPLPIFLYCLFFDFLAEHIFNIAV